MVAEPEEQVEHALGGLRVERPGRLVGEQQARLVRERPRHRDALALSAGELRGKVIGAIGEPHLLQQRERAAAALGAVHAGADERHFDVRASGQRAEQEVALEDEADELPTRAGRTRLGPHGAAVDPHPAGVGLLEAADQRQQRALAGAGAAGDRHRLPGGGVQRDLAQRADPPEALADTLDDHLRARRRAHLRTCTG